MPDPIRLPALQGQFGEWTYYSAVMPLSEVRDRVGFAQEIHRNERLKERIQRQLMDSSGPRNRAEEIASYLQENNRRFFNAIVVGVYRGDPVWHPFEIAAGDEDDELENDDLAAQDRVGFLKLNGTERLFAVDGQHRVAGIKRALSEGEQLEEDTLTVLFVPHRNSETGIARTRRLFVDLNKRAVPVDKKDIIILDEVDLAAIISRRLVDEHNWFSRGQVDIDRFNNTIPPRSEALFSIRTLYDVIARLLPKALASGVDERDELKLAERNRLADDRIDHYYQRALKYFQGLARANQQLKRYFNSGAGNGRAARARAADSRNVLFRPAGQVAFADAIGELGKRDGLESALRSARGFPMDLADPPFAGVIWDVERERMRASGASMAGRLLKYMCGIDPRGGNDTLRARYREVLGNPRARLPSLLDLG